MRPTFFAVCRLGCAGLLALLGGCAQVNDLGMRVFTAQCSGYLMVGGQLLSGSVYLAPDRSGRVEFSAPRGAVTACSGALHYNSTRGGTVALQCNDGSAVALPFQLISEARGYGAVDTGTAPLHLVFGLSDAQSRAYLPVPAGHALVDGEEGGLVLQ